MKKSRGAGEVMRRLRRFGLRSDIARRERVSLDGGGALAVSGSIVSGSVRAFLFSVGVDTSFTQGRVHHVTVRLTYTTIIYLKCKRYVSYYLVSQNPLVGSTVRTQVSR